jgi:hypothetical protein
MKTWCVPGPDQVEMCYVFVYFGKLELEKVEKKGLEEVE